MCECLVVWLRNNCILYVNAVTLGMGKKRDTFSHCSSVYILGLPPFVDENTRLIRTDKTQPAGRAVRGLAHAP